MKICIILTTRGNYAKFRVLMRLIKESEHELQIVTGGELVEDDRFLEKPDIFSNFTCYFNNYKKTCGNVGEAVIEFSMAFDQLNPDLILIVGDRFETFAAAQAAYFLRIPIGHLEGGEVSGTLDNKVRYAISALADYHFTCTEKAEMRLKDMGYMMVYNVGATSLDEWPTEFTGYDYGIDTSKPYLLVIHHPDTLHPEKVKIEHKAIKPALEKLEIPYYWVGPNMDEGAIQEGKSLPIELYGPLLANAACIVGNSSSGIREGSFLGTPNVTIGKRQRAREIGENTVHAEKNEIVKKIKYQLKHGRYSSDSTYGDGKASEKIMEVLCTLA